MYQNCVKEWAELIVILDEPYGLFVIVLASHFFIVCSIRKNPSGRFDCMFY